MQKYLKLARIIPEAIALIILFCTIPSAELGDICSLLLVYSIILRFIWNSAIIVHGLGHTMAIAASDRELSAINLINILEHQSLVSIFRSLIPFQQILIPLLSSSPYLTPGKPKYIRLKALGGIVLNVLVATGFYGSHSWWSQALVVANLLIAFASLSDLKASITGVANYFYCGNFGAIALRKPDDGQKLLPARIRNIVLQMGRETEIRGEQAGGGFVIASQQDNSKSVEGASDPCTDKPHHDNGLSRHTVFIGKKIVNRKRSNLTKSLEAEFAPIRNRAIAKGIKPLEDSVMGVWHYRYATSGTAPSKLETHWHEWMPAREREVWEFYGNNWTGKIKNVNHRITHNGDFESWRIFDRDVDNQTLGWWLERVLNTRNKTKGDSPKIAGMMDLLVTQGIWYPSVRLAYQQAIATSIEDAFGGQDSAANAPNTAPCDRQMKLWAEIFESSFVEEFSRLRNKNPLQIKPDSVEFLVNLQQNLSQKFSSHPATENWSRSQIQSFIQHTLKAFFANDLYRATKIFIGNAKGSFGLVIASTLEESELVLCAKGQPISVGFNRAQGYMVYASEPAAVDRVLLEQKNSFRLDLEQQQGEIAKVSASNIILYSLSQQRELRGLKLNDRWISMQHPHLSKTKFNSTDANSSKQFDPVARDINSIPQILNEIKTEWENPHSLNRRSADYLVTLFSEKVRRFEKRQQRMFKAGLLSKIRAMPAVDLLIMGEENSLWLGEKFARDLQVIFPFLNVATNSANQILQQLDQDFEQLNLNKDSLVLAITQSGQTFSTVRAIDVFDRLSSEGIIGELFILTGELTSFIKSTEGRGGLTVINRPYSPNENNFSTLLKTPQGKAPDSYRGSCISWDKKTDRRNKTNTQTRVEQDALGNESPPSRMFVNGSGRRTAEPCTIAVASGSQTLTELLLYLAKQMRNNFADSDPFGMTITQEGLMILAMMKEDFLTRNVPRIIGTNSKGEAIKSATRQNLVFNGRYWASHIIETPLAWAIHALYILISVGWAIPFGHTIPLVKTTSQLLFELFGLSTVLVRLAMPIVTLADIAVYIFGAWLWTLAIRYYQYRQLLARMGKRTLVIGDVPWVNQLLQAYVSKLFSLSYGIATIEVHSANPQNHLLHAFGHRIVRGTLIWLGIPDGRRSPQHQKAENTAIMTGKQANGVRNFNIGAEIIAIGNNPAIARQGFERSLILDSNDDSIYFRSITKEQKEQIEKLRESCFGSFERLLAGYVFFWALAKKVASFPFLKYEYWKSQSRTKVMTTASPVAGLDLSKLKSVKGKH